MAYDPTHEYEHNYHPAIESRKLANAANTKRKNWIASDDRAKEIMDFLSDYNPHGEGFFSACAKGIQQYGSLTPKMRDAMVKVLDKRAAKKAERAEKDAKSEFVGTVGERQEFSLKVIAIVPFEGVYGYSYLHLCRDENSNIICYRGTQYWGCPAQVTCTASVKQHFDRDGVKQTNIQRPTKVTINGEIV